MSILPIGTVLSTDSSAPAHAVTSPVLQARSTLSLTVSQTIPYPFTSLKTSKSLPTTQYSLRLLSPGPFGNSPLFLLSAPNDRTTLAAEGSVLWLFDLKGWDTQIDELVAECKYSEALELLDSLEDGSVPNKVCPVTRQSIVLTVLCRLNVVPISEPCTLSHCWHKSMQSNRSISSLNWM